LSSGGDVDGVVLVGPGVKGTPGTDRVRGGFAGAIYAVEVTIEAGGPVDDGVSVRVDAGIQASLRLSADQTISITRSPAGTRASVRGRTFWPRMPAVVDVAYAVVGIATGISTRSAPTGFGMMRFLVLRSGRPVSWRIRVPVR
jgi:hypothetical protein